MFYLATFKVVIEGTSKSHVEDVCDELLGELLNYENAWSDESTYDVQQMPQSWRPDSMPLPSSVTIGPATATIGQAVETDSAGVMHPWDQGAFIFPEDHPLRPLEEAAKQGNEEARQMLTQATKELASAPEEMTPVKDYRLPPAYHGEE